MPVRPLPQYIRKDGSLSALRYQAYFTDNRGKFRSATVDTVADGERWLAGQQALAEKGVVEPSKVKFGRIAAEWLDEQRQSLTRLGVLHAESDLRHYVIPAFGHRRLSELTPQDFIDFFAKLARSGVSGRPLKASTIRGLRATLSGVLARARLKNLLVRDVLADVKIRGDGPRRPTPDEDEVAAILREALRPTTSNFARAFVLTLHLTGCRGGELRALRWRDVDFDRRTIAIRNAADRWGTIKGPKTTAGVRSLEEIDALVLNALVALRAERDARPERLRFTGPDDFVFCTGRGTAFSHQNLAARVYSPVQVAAGVTRISMQHGKPVTVGKYALHAARRAYGSLLHQKGAMPIRAIASQLGHKHANFTLATYIQETSAAADRGRAVSAAFATLDLQETVQKSKLTVVSR